MTQATGNEPAYTPIGLRQQLLVAGFFLASALYLGWRPSTLNPDAPIFSLLVYAAELFGFMAATLHIVMTWRLSNHGRTEPDAGLTVDVLVPTFNEPLEVVRRTLLAAKAMDYPHTTWLLDDGKRPAMARLAHRLGCRYLTRDDNRHAKAGNLNHALRHCTGEFVAIFDADHAPHRSFLQKTLGHFRDPKVAFVQTPQDFYNLDSYQHRATRTSGVVWTEQSLFFRVIQRGKDSWNAAFFCGSCAILRRSALDRIGGFATETVTEDLHTSMRLHMEGFRSVYLSESLAFGIAPATLDQFLRQRLRWGQGAMQVWRREGLIFNRRLTVAQRLNYFASISTYFEGWQKAVFYLAPVVVLVSGTMPLLADGAGFLLRFLPYYLLSLLVFSEMGRGYGNVLLSEQYNVARFATFLTATFGLFMKNCRFVVTSKRREQTGRRTVAIPQSVVLWANAAAIPAGILWYATSRPVPLSGFLASEAWALANLLLAASLLAFTRRTEGCRRIDYRFRIPVAAQVETASAARRDVTVDDLSSAGFCFYGRIPEGLRIGEVLQGALRLPSGGVPFRASVRSLHLHQEKDGGTAYVRSVGCRFEELGEEAGEKIEQFLYGSDLQWQVNALTEQGKTAFEWLAGAAGDPSGIGSRTWTACETLERNADGIAGVISSGDTTRWLLLPTEIREGRNLTLEIHARLGTFWAVGVASQCRQVMLADSALTLVRLTDYFEWERAQPSQPKEQEAWQAKNDQDVA